MMQGEIPPKLIYHSSVTWKFKNVFYRRPDMNNTIESPVFKTKFNVPVTWRLTLCLRQKIGEEYKTVIYLGSHPPYVKPLVNHVTAVLEFTDITGNNHGPITGTFILKRCVYLDFSFLLIDDQITSYCKDNLTDSGEFKIKCDLYLDTSSSTHWSYTRKDLISLSIDLDTFYLAGNLTDLVLHGGDSKFHVHSTIVKLRSPYVADELNKTPGKQDVSFKGKCSEKDLKKIIRYWYSGAFYKLLTYPPVEFPSFVQVMKQQELKPYFIREEISLVSTFGKFNISLNWVIMDDHYFRQLQSLNNEVTNYDMKQQSWILHFYPKGETSMSNHISLCVEETGEIKSTRPAYLKIFFKGVDGKEYGRNNIICMLHSAGKYVFHDVLSHYEFTNLLPTLLLGNKLSIECRVQYGTGESEGNCKYEDVLNPESVGAIKHPYEILADKLKELWKIRKMGDVTLETEDGKKLQAHSAILAARSRYFELYLRKPESVACKSRVIKLPEIKKKDLELMLKYMYYAEIDLNLELALTLYPAVRKYKINVLEYLCSEYLQSHINVGCTLAVLDMADKSQDSSLRTTSLQFIVKNFGVISTTVQWKRFLITNAELASEIISSIPSST